MLLNCLWNVTSNQFDNKYFLIVWNLSWVVHYKWEDVFDDFFSGENRNWGFVLWPVLTVVFSGCFINFLKNPYQIVELVIFKFFNDRCILHQFFYVVQSFVKLNVLLIFFQVRFCKNSENLGMCSLQMRLIMKLFSSGNFSVKNGLEIFPRN